VTETLYPLLTLLAPSLGLSLAFGHAREWLPLLLGLYYAFPLLLHPLGRRLPLPGRLGVLGGLGARGEAYLPLLVLLLPYGLYWLAAGRMGARLGPAYAAFLKGPGLAVPLVLLVAWPLGVRLPPFAATLLLLGLFLLAERALRWAWGRAG